MLGQLPSSRKVSKLYLWSDGIDRVVMRMCGDRRYQAVAKLVELLIKGQQKCGVCHELSLKGAPAICIADLDESVAEVDATSVLERPESRVK